MTPILAIKHLRAVGWSEAEIAAAIEVNQSTIYRIAHGQASPKYETGMKLVTLAASTPRKEPRK